MSSNGHDSHHIEEKQPAEYLLEHLLETIHVQLEYAKKMDAEKLKEQPTVGKIYCSRVRNHSCTENRLLGGVATRNHKSRRPIDGCT